MQNTKRKSFTQYPTPELKTFEGNQEEIIIALGGEKVINPENFPFILDNGGYLYIHVSSLDDLMNIKPNFRELFNLSFARKGYDAFTIFTTETIEKDNHAHLRFFAPYGPNTEHQFSSREGATPPQLLIQY